MSRQRGYGSQGRGVSQIPLEVVVVGFDNLPVDTAHALVDRMDATGQVRVVSATVARHDLDGSLTTDDWSRPYDLSDVAADLAARHFLGLDGMIGTALAESLEPGETVLLLVVEHLWVASVYADVEALGGRNLASHLVPADRIRHAEGRLSGDGGH